MSTNEMTIKVQQLRELRRMADELDAEMEAIKDEIKAHMTARAVDELAGIDWKVTYKTVTGSRLMQRRSGRITRPWLGSAPARPPPAD